MRYLPVLSLLLLTAAPAAAAEPARAPSPAPSPEVMAALNDPAMADKMTRMAGALADALMDIKVGEIAAIAQGREATPAEKQQTVRQMGSRDDPGFERDLKAQVAASGPIIRQSMSAMAKALPAMMKAMEGLGDALEKASANLPDPTYPKR